MSWWLLIVATPALSVAGYLSRIPWLLPLLQIIPAYPMMVRDLRQGNPLRAILRLWLWAFLIGFTVQVLAVSFPEAGATSIIHGPAYRDEMIDWVRTGVGKEGTPSQFLPEHLIHLSLFVTLSLVSGSLLSLVLGAILMNYMSFYVGSLTALSAQGVLPFLLGWPPWAMIRVASYVILGVILAGPVLGRWGGVPFRWGDQKQWVAVACGGLVLDVLLKTILAGMWGEILRSALNSTPPGL